jgi:glutamate/tyrosine decarboxylase-like PLP-dependent enzyme
MSPPREEHGALGHAEMPGQSGVEALVDGLCANAKYFAQKLEERGFAVLNDVVVQPGARQMRDDGRHDGDSQEYSIERRLLVRRRAVAGRARYPAERMLLADYPQGYRRLRGRIRTGAGESAAERIKYLVRGSNPANCC